MTRPLTEGEAWREVARMEFDDEIGSGGLCFLVADLHDAKAIRTRTREAMYRHIDEHLDGAAWAYENCDPHAHEARCLAALWLAHEAEDRP